MEEEDIFEENLELKSDPKSDHAFESDDEDYENVC